MHSKGTLTTWKDEQGFGFATTEQQTDKVFVHIKNFSYKTRRPCEGDQLVYDIQMDANQRPQAVNIQFLHDFERKKLRHQRHNQAEEGKQLLSKIAAYPFILVLLILCFWGKISIWVLGYYVLLSLLTFFLYWQDKNAAQNNQRRTPEKTLHQWSFLGGWIGALIAQLSLRHKSQKKEFRETFWLTVLGNIIVFAVFVYFTWPSTF
jgi:uncharacterized membrane protein YsdA (DUF1294 family)/cold shock CspA family protein